MGPCGQGVGGEGPGEQVSRLAGFPWEELRGAWWPVLKLWSVCLSVCRARSPGGHTVGLTVTGTLGELALLALEVPVGHEVAKVTWSSGGLVAGLRPGPGGQPILAAGPQGRHGGQLSVPSAAPLSGGLGPQPWASTEPGSPRVVLRARPQGFHPACP